MKCLILSFCHGEKETITKYYNWHKKFNDIKIVWRTHHKINHPDIITLDVHKNQMFSSFCTMCRYALRYNYDYYFFASYDCWIIKRNFLELSMKSMKEDDIDTYLPNLYDRPEHWKITFYAPTAKKYGKKFDEIRWTNGNGILLSRNAAQHYHDKCSAKIHVEVELPSLMETYGKVAINPYIKEQHCSTSEKSAKWVQLIKDEAYVVHGVKTIEHLEGIEI